jgi:NADPH:quinone reductase-like Zn-dependent oxidoreductase
MPNSRGEHLVQRLAFTHIAEPSQAVELVSADEPSPGPGRALIRMEAATINPTDFLYVAGQYFLTPTAGDTVGSEGVGRVIAVGPDTDTAILGQRVALLATYRHGTWSTHTVASVTDLIAVPDGGDALQLAMLGINPMTALRLLRDHGDPEDPHRWVGQTAANSAVGEYLVKLAIHLGHHTLNIVRRDGAADAVRRWGADRVVVDGSDLDRDVADALAGESLDIAVDSVGGPASATLGHHLRYGGTLVTYAAQSGQSPVLSQADLIGKQANLTGFWLYNWWQRTPLAQARDEYRQLVELIADGTLSARVDRTFPLTDWREAMEAARTPSGAGKLLFTFQDN